MKQISFIACATLVLLPTFILAYRDNSRLIWGVFVFLVVVAVIVYLFAFQRLFRATLKAFGVEATFEKAPKSQESDGAHATMPPFNESEKKVLRYLYKVFVEVEENPEWERIPVERIITDNKLNPDEGRNVIRRFDTLRILRKVGADPEWLRFRYINPVVCELVACLDDASV